MTSLPKLACLAVAAGGVLAVTGCGNDVPAGSVAKVGDTPITKQDFDKWLATAAKGQAQGGKGIVPDPPNYSNCVAAKKASQPKKSGQQPDSSLKKQCKQDFDRLKGEVMQFLIQAQWVQQESKARDVKVSGQEVQRSFEDQKSQAFPNEKEYNKFLGDSGMTEKDILFRVKLDLLQQKLQQNVTKDAGKVTDKDVREYYDKNKKRFAQPETRDLQIVITKTKAKAEAAKSQLGKGGKFSTVAKRYSIDEASKSQGGKLTGVAKGQQERAIDSAVFKAKRNKLVGPVKGQFGWYVFEVTKVTAASQQSFDQAKAQIKSLLQQQNTQEALTKYSKDFRDGYKDKTHCADDFVVSECDNAPKEKTDTGPASGGAPQGQGAPTPQQGGGPTPTPTPTPTPAPQGTP